MSHFNLIPVTYSQLYSQLLQNSLVTPRAIDPLPALYVPYDNANATCKYQEGAIGHFLDTCLGLKAKMQELINKNIITFKGVVLNVKTNPFPGHGE